MVDVLPNIYHPEEEMPPEPEPGTDWGWGSGSGTTEPSTESGCVWVVPAEEGDQVLFTIGISEDRGFHFWTTDVSAENGTDYVFSATSEQNPEYVTPEEEGENWWYAEVPINTMDNEEFNYTKSFAIHMVFDGEEVEYVFEADIFDDGDELDEAWTEYGWTHYVTYAYDAANQLVLRTVDLDGAGEEPTTEEYFAWQDNQIVLQWPAISRKTSRTATSSTPSPWITCSPSRTSPASPRPAKCSTRSADHLSTNRDVVVDNGEEILIVNHRLYTAFGEFLSETNAGYTIAFGFTGVYFDITTSLNYHRNRWYDPATANGSAKIQ